MDGKFEFHIKFWPFFYKNRIILTASLWISDTSPAMGFLVEMSLWALVMAFYTLFMVFGPEKNFKLISGRFGENPEFLCFQLFFRPQKVFLLPIFLLLTRRPWALGHFIRAKGWSKKYFFPVCLLLTFCRICIEKFYFFCVEGPYWEPKTNKCGTMHKNPLNQTIIKKYMNFDNQLKNRGIRRKQS